MSDRETPNEAVMPDTERVTGTTEPPIGWDSNTLQEMLDERNQLLEETGHYRGLETLEMKEENRFEYEQLYSRLRGALVSARETALHISASPVVREIGELCFQIYTPEGDCVALSTGIIVHVHTGSLAIKWMIEEDYEHDRGINPGDVFCNNDNELGNVHTTDIHTLVPIFDGDELVAWVDGVTHETDIGGMTRGHDQVASVNRYQDGMYVTCEKIGENDELYQDWKERGKRSTRVPMYWDLDEKCRLAGCHMIREAIHDMVDDVGSDTFKQFLQEAVEEGRRTMRERVKERLFPGTYRHASFSDLPYEQEAWQPGSKVDMLNHLPVEMEVKSDGTLRFDMTGASPSGPHSYHASEGSMTGGLWVSLTQSLVHDGKVNDGSHEALETHFPEGSIVNPQDPNLSYHASWGSIFPTFQAFWQNMSRSYFARGYHEEISAGYSMPQDAVQGGGRLKPENAESLPDALGEYFPVTSFEMSCNGFGASAVDDGLDWGYAMFNPESDMGDVEEWEQTQWGLLQLSRTVKPNTAGHGKYRGGSGWEGVYTVVGSEDVSLYNLASDGDIFGSAGMSGGYPGGTRYQVQAHNTDLPERIQNQEAYPIDDSPPGSFEEDIEGDIKRTHHSMFWPTEFDNFDVLHYKMGGGPGWGDPLERPVDKVKEDVEDEIYTPDIVEDVYGVVGTLDVDERDFDVDEEATAQRREEIRRERADETVDYEEFWEEEQSRLLENDYGDPVEWMYTGVFDQSEEWADRFTEFWELPDDYDPSKGGEDE